MSWAVRLKFYRPGKSHPPSTTQSWDGNKLRAKARQVGGC